MKKVIAHFCVILMVLLIVPQQSFGQDDILFRKHVVSSGWHGLLYGIALDIIFELDGPAAAGIPVITAGGSILAPFIFNPERSIDYDVLILSGHGKSLGWVHGFGLATLIGGENAWNEDNYKLTVAAGALTSIGGGILARQLAANNDWSEGRVGLYQHYGWIMPFTGMSLSAAFSDEPRVYGAAALLGGAAGYFIGGKVSDWNDFTRGEVRATQVLTTLTGGLGYGIMMDAVVDEPDRSSLIIPATGLLAGTVIGHFWTRNANLTPQQGNLTAYAAAGGAVIGLGIALLTESEKATPYYAIPFATGLGAYAFTLERLRRSNNSYAYMPVKQRNNFQFAFMPQSLFINNKIGAKIDMTKGRMPLMQPLFAASLQF
jgi:hypothetical protein